MIGLALVVEVGSFDYSDWPMHVPHVVLVLVFIDGVAADAGERVLVPPSFIFFQVVTTSCNVVITPHWIVVSCAYTLSTYSPVFREAVNADLVFDEGELFLDPVHFKEHGFDLNIVVLPQIYYFALQFIYFFVLLLLSLYEYDGVVEAFLLEVLLIVLP